MVRTASRFLSTVIIPFGANNVALGQIFLRGLCFAPGSIFPPMSHIHPHFNTALIRTSEKSLGTFKKISALLDNAEHWIKSTFTMPPPPSKFQGDKT
jgi:hypothetical protein